MGVSSRGWGPVDVFRKTLDTATRSIDHRLALTHWGRSVYSKSQGGMEAMPSVENHNGIIHNPDEARDKISAWLKAEGGTVEVKKQAHLFFLIEFTNKHGRVYNIFQHKDRVDKVVVSVRLVLSPKHRKGLQNIPQRIKRAWLTDVGLSLLHHNLNFTFLPKVATIDEVIVRKPIWYDGVSKNALLQTVRQVDAGESITIFKLRRLLGRP